MAVPRRPNQLLLIFHPIQELLQIESRTPLTLLYGPKTTGYEIKSALADHFGLPADLADKFHVVDWDEAASPFRIGLGPIEAESLPCSPSIVPYVFKPSGTPVIMWSNVLESIAEHFSDPVLYEYPSFARPVNPSSFKARQVHVSEIVSNLNLILRMGLSVATRRQL